MMKPFTENWHRFFMEVTNRCNFDCLFCPSGISQRTRHDMDRSLAFSLIDQLHELGFRKTIYFHVLGEPLLHPSVFHIVNRAAEAEMRPVVFTNGGALTGETVQKILDSKASELVISMQTINRQSYEMLRRTPFDWDTYLGRVQNALAMASSAGGRCRFRVSMGIKKTDTEHPEELYFLEYESPEHVKDSIGNIFNQVDGIDLTHVYTHLDARGVAGMPIMRITDALSLSVKPMGNWRRTWREERASSGHCSLFGQEMAVLSNGNVTLCHIDYDGRTTIGNIGEKSLMDIISATEFMRMAEDFMSGTSVARGCEHCRGVKSQDG